MPKDMNIFGETNYRNRNVKFGIKRNDRRRHFYVVGKTGMGKSFMLKHMAIQDIYNGEGVAIFDPHGDFAEETLKKIPPHRYKDVIYFDPADMNFPIALNVLESVDLTQRHLVASGLVSVFKKIWADSWGPRLEYVLRNAILALLEAPDSTLLGIMRILYDNDYRKNVLQYVTNSMVRSFWIDEYSKYPDKLKAEAVAPIQNKVGQFLSSTLMRNIVGQVKSSFDIRQAMDQRKILIFNLSKGKIGEDNSGLLGAMLITKLQMAAMSRVDIVNEDDRADFYVYVDEFQNFATESFAGILSEARKYRLNLILAHQYIAQLSEEVRDAVFGNVGTLLTFRVGAEDASFLQKEFSPNFTEQDIVNLKAQSFYLKLMINGVASDAFSGNSLPPLPISISEETGRILIEQTRKNYAHSKHEVEESIARWAYAPGGVVQTTQAISTQQVVSQPVTIPGIAPSQTIQNSSLAPQQNFGVSPQNNFSPENNSQTIQQSGNLDTTSNFSLYGSSSASEPDPNRPMFQAQCSGCGEQISVPFKPDGSRPVLCKQCLPIYRSLKSKIELPETVEGKIFKMVQDEFGFVQKKTLTSGDYKSSTKNSFEELKKIRQKRVEKDQAPQEIKNIQNDSAPVQKPLTLKEALAQKPTTFR